MLYSVSPRRKLDDRRVEAELELQHADADPLGGQEWPSSCTNTSTPSTNDKCKKRRHAAQPQTFNSTCPRATLRIRARPRVHRAHRCQRRRGLTARARPCVALDDVGRSPGNRAAPRETRRPPPRWPRSARPAGCARPRARDRPAAGRETRPCPARRKSSGAGAREIERRQRRGPALGIRKRVLNRQPHVGHAELRDDRPVASARPSSGRPTAGG